ncbi:putative ATP synthase epsilon chain [Neospora caninum Liverpool]|uniref:ATP synthase epsilon chain, putative n=4 Tax=Sarcocystidae TaxID=5809 RepID=F0VNQ2_NEOCL|nr:putative ATP synthase epsilon chain [Neospora caninum Liverpool]CBZ55348.1 putative ATP synthase epsilon chain [Neospora caninum Liverpool]CEL70083.1 TPA: ATP synthase epsilon chain, putative [Neospora caninum Liverpool]|eukprot:XP_003885376.1 putative ATP synthase epsilon chain [Neospora caninum Liverpool]
MMWRSSGVSFTRYASEMAALLRQCLKEPYRTQAMQRNQIHLKETVYQQGQVLTRETFNDIKKAFEAAAKQGGEK